MSDAPDPLAVEAEAARLYALLPEHVRTTDSAQGRPLATFLSVLASGSAEVEAEIDALFDAMFVETASPAALPDLAALVAAEPLKPLPAATQTSERAYIANTLRYRRGKGTARVLEALATDVGGFGAVAVEYFQRLARLQNLIDLRPDRPATATLVSGEIAAHIGTAFDATPRLPDMRSIARARGRHHHLNVGVHILRPLALTFPAPPGDDGLSEADLAGVPLARGWPIGGSERAGHFQLAAQPAGVVRLFNPDRRSQTEDIRVVEQDLADRLKRLPLHLETEELRRAALEARPAKLAARRWFDEEGQPFTVFLGRTVAGKMRYRRVPPAEVLIVNLETPPMSPFPRPKPVRRHGWTEAGLPTPTYQEADSPIACAFDPVTGRLVVADPGAGADIERVRIAHSFGRGAEIGAGPHERNDATVPFDVTDGAGAGNLVWVVAPEDAPPIPTPTGVKIVASFAAALAGWEADGKGRRGFIVLAACDRAVPAAPATDFRVTIHPGSELHIVSARWVPTVTRPGLAPDPGRLGFLVRRERCFTIGAPLILNPVPANTMGGRLVLDGVELTGGVRLSARAVSTLRVRHCVLRAPGASAIATTAPLAGSDVVIEKSLVGAIVLDFATGPATGTLAIADTIVSPDGVAGDAIAAAQIDATLVNVTILGSSRTKSLEATNVIFAGASSVERRQAGCVRYSSLATWDAMPRRFRCQPDLTFAAITKDGVTIDDVEAAAIALGAQPLFLDRALDEPTAAMLHPLTPDGIRLGGEKEAEIGAFATVAAGLRTANLATLFDDYVPVGLEAAVLDDTRSTTVALRRDRP